MHMYNERKGTMKTTREAKAQCRCYATLAGAGWRYSSRQRTNNSNDYTVADEWHAPRATFRVRFPNDQTFGRSRLITGEIPQRHWRGADNANLLLNLTQTKYWLS